MANQAMIETMSKMGSALRLSPVITIRLPTASWLTPLVKNLQATKGETVDSGVALCVIE
jgi:hypothetical protein